MRFGKENSYKKVLYSKGSVLVLLVITILLSMSVFKRFTVERDMVQERMKAQQNLDTLIAQKAALTEQVKYMSGNRGVEQEIRQDFDVAKPGEQVVILTGGDTGTSTTAPATTTPSAPLPWYHFW